MTGSYILIEKIIWYLGSSIAIISGFIKLKEFFERPRIYISGNFLREEGVRLNRFGQEEITQKYTVTGINTGKDIPGQFILKAYLLGIDINYLLGQYQHLKKNKPLTVEGEVMIYPFGINVKQLPFPFKARLYFQDHKGKKYSPQHFLFPKNNDYIGLPSANRLN